MLVLTWRLRHFLRWAPFSLALHLCSSKVIKKWSKIYTKLTSDFKNYMRNFYNFRQVVESPKSWNSMGYICLRTTFLHLKNYLPIYLTLLSSELWFGKWQKEYGKFFPEHSKMGFWWDPLVQTRKSKSLKSTEELSVMTMKKCAKFEGELTCHFKADMKNLTNFDPSTWKSQKFSFLMGSFSAKYILLELKKYREVIFHETEEGCKIWRGIDSSFQNWHEEFDKFWPGDSKVSKIFTLIGSFWAKYVLLELKRYRGVIFPETEEGCKIWRGIDLSVQKLA